MKIHDGRIVEATMPELYALYHRGYGGAMAKMFTFAQFLALIRYAGTRIAE